MTVQNLNTFIYRLPKVELHLHLEGSIKAETALELMRRNRVPQIPDKAEQVNDFYKFNNLTEFVDGMKNVSNNIRYLEDLERITEEMLLGLVQENVRYVEFDCAIQKYLNLGYKINDIVDTLYKSIRTIETQHDITVRMLVNILRVHGPDEALRLVQIIRELNHPYIVGVGLSGDEIQYPQELFQKAFKEAKAFNIRRTAHAGEAVGPPSIWNAIQYLEIDRIDHGTRAIEDDDLVEYLAEKQIPLTQCITSNLKLKVVSETVKHPFGKFLRKGLLVTLNTDDPQVFGTQLIDEYLLAARAFDLNAVDLEQIVLNGIKASFINTDEKEKLLRKVKSETQHLKAELKFV